MKERERKEREAKKAELKKKMAAFRALLEHTPGIKVSCSLQVSLLGSAMIKLLKGVRSLCLQTDSQWRKIQGKLEGEDEYEALDKLDRLEVFQEYIR